MKTESHNSNPKREQCRRKIILERLLSIVKEIEEYDKHPQDNYYPGNIEEKHHYPQDVNYDHYGVKHDQHGVVQDPNGVKSDQQSGIHKDHSINNDPSCRCEGDVFVKDEYYQPMTVDGQPARPVLTRRGGAQPFRWCPPCFQVVPTMDYTLSCYRPSYMKHTPETHSRPMDINQVGDERNAHQPERLIHEQPEKENKNLLHEYDNNKKVVTHDPHAVKHDQQCMTHGPYDVKHDYQGVTHGPYGVKHDQQGVTHGPYGVKHDQQGVTHGSYGVKHDQQGVTHGPYDAKRDQQGVTHVPYGVKHDQSPHLTYDHCGKQENQRNIVSAAPHYLPSQQQAEMKNHTVEKKQDRKNLEQYLGISKCVYDPAKDSSRRVSCHEENKMEPQRLGQPHSGRPEAHHWEGGDCNVIPYVPKDIGRHHPEEKPHEPRRYMPEQPGIPPEGLWTLKQKEYPKHHTEHEPGTSKHQGPFPKVVIVLNHNENSKHQNENQTGRFDESKYYPVLIPKDVVWPKKQDVHSQHQHSRYDETKYQPLLIPNEVINRGPSEASRYPVPNQHNTGKIHHGRPEKCNKERLSTNGAQNHCSKVVPTNERRNGLAPQAKDEVKKGNQGQSIICYEDGVRRIHQDAMNMDVYGGQKCPHVHPPGVFFTYSCPENDKQHNHWSPPETTICRYPNTCVASCFEHPVFNNWVYQQPSYRYYLQSREYTPF